MGSSKYGLKPLDVDNGDLINKVRKITRLPATRFEKGGVDDQLQRLCLQRCQSRWITVGKEIQNQRYSNVRNCQELDKALRIRRSKNISKRGQLLVVQMQNIILVDNGDRFRSAKEGKGREC